MSLSNETILTGDRPTGPLHLGHLAGSLLNRVALQERNRQTILIADLQALTDNAGTPERVRDNVMEVMLDYLAVGIDPTRSTIALQSALPALARLNILYLNLISVARLERNPTIRAETEERGFGGSVPAGFLCYPVSQAADITGFEAGLVPAGADQAPLIETTNEIVRRVNALCAAPVLRECRLLMSHSSRLPGIDGQGKMSKSQGNAIAIGAEADTLRAAIMAMFTDPGHLRVADPGQVEGNVVFAFLDAFDEDQADVEALKAHYRQGGLGDMVLKRRLNDILQARMAPIRARRAAYAADPGEVLAILARGTLAAREVTERQYDRVAAGMGIFSLP